MLVPRPLLGVATLLVAACSSPAPAAPAADSQMAPPSAPLHDPRPPMLPPIADPSRAPVTPFDGPPAAGALGQAGDDQGRLPATATTTTTTTPIVERRPDMASQSDELEASIAELEASLASADPESRAMLEQQLSTMRQLRGMLRAAESAAGPRPPELSPEMRAFFTPAPPAEVPAWVPDTLERSQVTEETMRCPSGARVYEEESSVGCGLPQPSGPPFRHGLELGFHRSTGRLRYQRFYDNRLLRWAIEYHTTGGRELVGRYVATERLEYPEEGLHTRFAPNGTVVSQTWYREGVPHGWSKMWNDDGTPIGATRFEGGVAVEQVLPDGSRRSPAASQRGGEPGER